MLWGPKRLELLLLLRLSLLLLLLLSKGVEPGGELVEAIEEGLEKRACKKIEGKGELLKTIDLMPKSHFKVVRHLWNVTLFYFLKHKRDPQSSQTHLNRDKIESNLSVPGFQGRHKNALIKDFKMSPPP